MSLFFRIKAFYHQFSLLATFGFAKLLKYIQILALYFISYLLHKSYFYLFSFATVNNLISLFFLSLIPHPGFLIHTIPFCLVFPAKRPDLFLMTSGEKMFLQWKYLSYTECLRSDLCLLLVIVLLWILYELYFLSTSCSYITQILFPYTLHDCFKAHTHHWKEKLHLTATTCTCRVRFIRTKELSASIAYNIK